MSTSASRHLFQGCRTWLKKLKSIKLVKVLWGSNFSSAAFSSKNTLANSSIGETSRMSDVRKPSTSFRCRQKRASTWFWVEFLFRLKSHLSTKEFCDKFGMFVHAIKSTGSSTDSRFVGKSWLRIPVCFTSTFDDVNGVARSVTSLVFRDCLTGFPQIEESKRFLKMSVSEKRGLWSEQHFWLLASDGFGLKSDSIKWSHL